MSAIRQSIITPDTKQALENLEAARAAIMELTGPIKLQLTDGHLVAEMNQGANSALISKINMVAGAGFEPTTFGL